MKKQRVIAAIDFGTHGTGYAWTIITDKNNSARSREIFMRDKWPGYPVPYPKNLSALLLDESNEVVAWGYEARRRWAQLSGRPEGKGMRYHYAFKMSIANDPSTTAAHQVGGILTAEESKLLFSAHLREVVRAAHSEITASGFTEDQIRWCVTVPAIWTEYQKQMVREAAIEAGLPEDENRLTLALEPEAAAYYARVSGVRTANTSGRRANLMSPGSRFLVADCGGGTIDITAYRTDAKNRLEEIGRECGGRFGSEYLNQGFFESILAVRFGSFATLAYLREHSPAAVLDLIDSWEKEKLHFEGDLVDNLYLPIPASIYRLLDESTLKSLSESQGGITDSIVVAADEMRNVFEAVISNILGLVDKQIGEMRRQRRNSSGKELVILVGGFASSPYLQKRLAAHLEGVADLLVPPDPHTAVLRGAVHFTYDPQTRARRTKMSYGCNVAEPFVERVDPKDLEYLGPDGKKYCGSRFLPFVRAGQSIPVDEEVDRVLTPI
ncbi:Hsp70 family protein [Kitasatospora sp. NPDC057015]|uniref:Hsp70 family protein n=1 Tax=Kitasatospora sp. NPDC057015 TaxID=3346001 RepID=UPI00363C90D8